MIGMRGTMLLLIATISFINGELLGGVNQWCREGTVTQTTEECICPTHTGHFCQGSNCGSGFGMSFYHKTCGDCKCAVSTEWLERKKALNAGRPTRKGGKKGKAGKAGGKKEGQDDAQI